MENDKLIISNRDGAYPVNRMEERNEKISEIQMAIRNDTDWDNLSVFIQLYANAWDSDSF